MSTEEIKNTIEYLRRSIFEALGAYNGWKMIQFSRSNKILTQELAEYYVRVQKYHGSFFLAAQNAFLFEFIIQTLHPFDQDLRAASLYNLEKVVVLNFINENAEVIKSLKDLRDKIFAHRDKYALENPEEFKVPSIDNLDVFFKNLIDFYNKISVKHSMPLTLFDDADYIKEDIENLFANIDRGESVRIKEIDIEYFSESKKKASDLL